VEQQWVAEKIMPQLRNEVLADGRLIGHEATETVQAGDLELHRLSFKSRDSQSPRYLTVLAAPRYLYTIVVFAESTTEEGYRELDASLRTLQFVATVPKRVRVSQGAAASNLIKKVDPHYPRAAKDSGIQGTVLLTGLIQHDGSLCIVEVVSGPPELVASTLDAVRQWRYEPYRINGQPVEVETRISVNYRLR